MMRAVLQTAKTAALGALSVVVFEAVKDRLERRAPR